MAITCWLLETKGISIEAERGQRLSTMVFGVDCERILGVAAVDFGTCHFYPHFDATESGDARSALDKGAHRSRSASEQADVDQGVRFRDLWRK